VACGELEAARALFRRMTDRGEVDVVSYNTLLKGLAADASGCGEAEALLQEMRAKGFRPNAVTYNSLLNASVSRGDTMDASWQLVENMEAQGVPPDGYTCSILIKGLRNSSRREDVDRALRLLERRDIKTDEILLNTLLEACVRLKDARRLTQVIQRVEKRWQMNPDYRSSGGSSTSPSPAPISAQTCGTLMKAYGFLRQMDQVWKVWEDLKSVHRLEANDMTYAALIEACVMNGAVHEAIRIFGEMKKVLPEKAKNPMFYAILIKGFAQRKESHRAMQLYQDMKRENIPVNLVTFNTLIDGCARVGDMEQAAALFTEMCTMDGVEPDLITYSTCVKGYCVQGDLDQAVQLFTMMRRKGIQPDAILFNSILDGCAKRQMRSLAESVLEDMKQTGITPSNITLSILVKLYGRCRDLDRAFELVEEVSTQYGFQVNTHVFTCLMSACMANQTAQGVERAMKVFREMSAKSCTPDAKTYETLLNGALRHQEMRAAAEILQAALDQAQQQEQSTHGGTQKRSWGNNASSSHQKPTDASTLLDQEQVENVLFMIGRRSLTAELGIPLLEKLKKRHFAISEKAIASVMRGSVAEEKEKEMQSTTSSLAASLRASPGQKDGGALTASTTTSLRPRTQGSSSKFLDKRRESAQEEQ